MGTSRIASLTLQSDDQFVLRSYIRLRPLDDAPPSLPKRPSGLENRPFRCVLIG